MSLLAGYPKKLYQESQCWVTADEVQGVEKYLVAYSSSAGSAQTAITDLGFGFGHAFPDNPACLFQFARASAYQRQDYIWLVEVRYSTQISQLQDQYTWSGGSGEEEPVNFDVNNVPITNTAYQPFSPPITQPARVAVCNVLRYYLVTGFNPGVVLNYINTTNSSSVTLDGVTFNTGKCFLKNIQISSSVPQYIQGNYYRTVNFSIECRANADWYRYDQTPVGSYGTAQLVDGQQKSIIQNGLAVTTPYPLDEDGVAESDPSSPPFVIQLALTTSTSWGGLGFHSGNQR